jgi:tetratricopeptide (TPR) repeat protein
MFNRLTSSIVLAIAASAMPAAAAPPDNMPLIGANEPNDGPLLNPATLYKDSVDALKAKRFAEAKIHLANLLLVVPADAETNFLAGLADAGLNDWSSARKHYEAAVRYNRKLIQAQQELAVTYARLGQFEKTEQRLRELERQNAECGGTCPEAARLQTAITVVRKALG